MVSAFEPYGHVDSDIQQGSDTDLATLKPGIQILKDSGVSFEVHVCLNHPTSVVNATDPRSRSPLPTAHLNTVRITSPSHQQLNANLETVLDFGRQAASRGFKVIVAAAGGAAHLPGMIASETTLPVVGVPVKARALDGLDSLLAINAMP